ncbi:oxidoreductase [Phenylobacterium hankyongense]|uniref:Probable oxidoreductase n=1 Tax=Phenylobacterium hankyongense TaxID=1813876 RepID=A0A328B2Q0_9CAUL|nr:oxidoreductase [Phenylobacterium hankyongense]RAK60114.1 oxidoreductase [Phenylobacterium hankyongense]
MAERITSGLDPYTDASVVADDYDLTGRTAIVTGGASGIGVETARALAGVGAEVMIAVRNREAGEQAAADINASIGAERVSVGALDLADLASVEAFASAWGETPLHMLINNAGVMACPQSYTAQDLEMQVGVNHFGHFLLSAGLLRALMNGAEEGRAARLVSLSSSGHRRSDILWDDMHYRTRPYDKWQAYGQSKTANSLFAVGFHERFNDLGITANAVMPGGILTPLQRHLPREEMVALGWINADGELVAQGFKTPAQGASTSVWAAIGEELEGVGGLYLENLAQAEPFVAGGRLGVMPHALDPDSAERLWIVSEETLGVIL